MLLTKGKTCWRNTTKIDNYEINYLFIDFSTKAQKFFNFFSQFSQKTLDFPIFSTEDNSHSTSPKITIIFQIFTEFFQRKLNNFQRLISGATCLLLTISLFGRFSTEYRKKTFVKRMNIFLGRCENRFLFQDFKIEPLTKKSFYLRWFISHTIRIQVAGVPLPSGPDNRFSRKMSLVLRWCRKLRWGWCRQTTCFSDQDLDRFLEKNKQNTCYWQTYKDFLTLLLNFFQKYIYLCLHSDDDTQIFYSQQIISYFQEDRKHKGFH